jgi:hypothetical protein
MSPDAPSLAMAFAGEVAAPSPALDGGAETPAALPELRLPRPDAAPAGGPADAAPSTPAGTTEAPAPPRSEPPAAPARFPATRSPGARPEAPNAFAAVAPDAVAPGLVAAPPPETATVNEAIAPLPSRPPAPPDPASVPSETARAALAGPPPTEAAPPAAMAALPPAPPEPPAPAQPEAEAALATRVMLHYPRGADGNTDAAVAALSEAGASTNVIPAGFAISATNVRYYHASDLDAAEAVAELLSNLEGMSVEARDFTSYRPSPDPGMVEVWLAGVPPASVPPPPAASAQREPAPARAAAPRRAAPATSPAPQPTNAQRAAEAAAERERMRQQVEQLLTNQLRELRRR